MKLNGCINILSSRTKCLPLCIKSLWDNWNYKYNYPVYVHYFDDIYEDPSYYWQWDSTDNRINFNDMRLITHNIWKQHH